MENIIVRIRINPMQIVLMLLAISMINCDCPINNYPRQTLIDSMVAQINNDPNIHGIPQQYTYSLQQNLQQSAISVAIGINSFQVNPHGILDYSVEWIPSTLLSSLRFKVFVNDTMNGWKSLKYTFFVTQSNLFQTSIQMVNQFSGDIESGKYSIYRPILNFNNFQNQPNIRVFLNGIKIRAKPLGQQYNTMLAQYNNFKKFSSNQQLVTYFSQALEQTKSISYRMYGNKILGRILTFSIETNSILQQIRFSYLIFSKTNLIQKHNFALGDFCLVNSNQFKFSSLQNMNMMLTGLTGFKLPRDQLYQFNLINSNYFSQSYFDVQTNIKYYQISFTYIALEMKNQYICNDCQNSPLIYDNKFCVNICPRSYSPIERLNVTYCQKCDILKLKVIDPFTNECTCAKRHYLDQYLDTCKPCLYDCMTCSQSDKCLTCDNSMMQTKRKLTNQGRCQCPLIGYYDNIIAQDIICMKCHDSCVTCNGPKQHDCLSCNNDREIDVYGFCVCKNGYFDDGNNNCVCRPPNILFNNNCLDTQTQCNQNQTQQYIKLTRRCICKAGFIQIINNCLQCPENSIFDQQTLNCKCVNRTVYSKNNNKCVACIGNQVYDEFAKICVCKAGTFKTQDGYCISCPPKMAYINQKCQCIFNYYESSPGVCLRCVLETDGPKCRRTSF